MRELSFRVTVATGLSSAYLLLAACGTDPGTNISTDALDARDELSDGGSDAQVDLSEPDATDLTDESDAAELPEPDAEDDANGPELPVYFDAFVDDGWLDSEAPLCNPDPEGVQFDSQIWAGESAIFVTRMVSLGESLRLRILGNAGDGWLELPGDSSSLLQASGELVGLDDDTLWLVSQSRLYEIDANNGIVVDAAISGVISLHVDSPERACALVSAAPGVLIYDGEWAPISGEPLPFPARDLNSIWCDADRIYLAGRNGTVVSRTADAWFVHDTREVEDLSLVWGDDERIWATTITNRILFYDGNVWSAIEWNPNPDSSPCSSGEATLRTLSGRDGVAFATTSSTVLRLSSDEGVEVLADWSGVVGVDGQCSSPLVIRDAWATAANRLFLVADEISETESVCEEFVLFFDGESFHWI